MNVHLYHCRDLDFLMSGQRHPFLTKYNVGVDANGYIKALDCDMYCNAGYSMDLSFSVLHRYNMIPILG